MPFEGRPFPQRAASIPFSLLLLALGASGCASPGAPKPPSLHIPQPVRDLTAARSGDLVQIRFTVPTQTTDGLPLRGALLHASLCLQVGPGTPCHPVQVPQAAAPLRAPDPDAQARAVLWEEALPRNLLTGAVRPIMYRMQLSGESGRSAGFSDPAYVAAGAAPPPVQSFSGQGIRSGLLFQWTPEPGKGEVLLERTQLDPPPQSEQKKPQQIPKALRSSPLAAEAAGRSAKEGIVWLQAAPGDMAAAQTIDGSMTEGVRYRYAAVRRTVAQVGGRTLELRSAPSAPVEIAWRDVYPAATPAGLTAVGFQSHSAGTQESGPYAVDLIWQPVEDARVTGYLVRRIPLSADGSTQGEPELLTPKPVAAPAFHDTTAQPGRSYRYEVSSTDAKGNTSSPVITTVQAAGH